LSKYGKSKYLRFGIIIGIPKNKYGIRSDLDFEIRKSLKFFLAENKKPDKKKKSGMWNV
jgi:hypothetical protein